MLWGARRAPFRRTLLAACLLAVAVMAPTSAWYLSGSREAQRRSVALTTEARQAVNREVQRAADRLATRLETLRVSECARPFYHYQNLYHDPRGASQGLSVMPSPLALGAQDLLVQAHFQIDDHGQVSLPTVNEQFPELSADQGFVMYCDILTALQNGLVVAAEGQPLPAASEEERVLILQRAAWEQNLLADAVYASLTLTGSEPGDLDHPHQAAREAAGGRGGGGRSGRVGDGEPQHNGDSVVIRVRPLQWRTIVLGSDPVLAALREVTTPNGILVQGFSLNREAVTDWLDTGDPALTFTAIRPGEGEEGATGLGGGGSADQAGDSCQVSLPVGETGWYLQADATPAVRTAAALADEANRRFGRMFALTATAALFAALTVVVIVAQADRLARQRARFAAAAAHELRTPLSSLRLYSEMLADGLGDPSRASTYAGRIATEVARLGRVVMNMLDLSRLERGAALVENTSPGDPGDTVRSCVLRLRPALEAAGITLQLTIEPRLPQVRFDADALCQIIHNLLDNAEKHTRSISGRHVRVILARHGAGVRLEVTDNGPGIAAAEARHLFRAFARGTHDTAGLGLGLALARSLARAQGGDLTCDTGCRQGASFVVSLAAAD